MTRIHDGCHIRWSEPLQGKFESYHIIKLFTNMCMMSKYGYSQWPSWKSVCKQTTSANFGSLPVCKVKGQPTLKSLTNVISRVFFCIPAVKDRKMIYFAEFYRQKYQKSNFGEQCHHLRFRICHSSSGTLADLGPWGTPHLWKPLIWWLFLAPHPN